MEWHMRVPVAMEERIQWPGKGFEASLCHMKVTADSLQMCKTWWSQEDQQKVVAKLI